MLRQCRLWAFVIATVLVVGSMTAAPAQALTSKNQLLNAPIPSVCGHKAGRLVKGRLPGIARNRGEARLRLETATLGTLVKGGGVGAVAAIQCNRGGVSWPDHIVVWNRHKQVIGHYDTAKVSAYNRIRIMTIAVKNREITAYMRGVGATDEAACCMTRSARVRMSWSPTTRRVIVRSRTIYYERSVALALVAAVNKRHRTTALKYGTSTTVSDLLALRARVATMRVGRCFGAGMSQSDFWDAQVGERGCTVEVTYRYNGRSYPASYGLRMVHPTRTAMSWKASGLHYMSGV